MIEPYDHKMEIATLQQLMEKDIVRFYNRPISRSMEPEIEAFITNWERIWAAVVPGMRFKYTISNGNLHFEGYIIPLYHIDMVRR